MYASKTAVPIEKSRMEIERMLVRFGATAFGSQWDGTHARIGFTYNTLTVRFEMKLPSKDDERFRMATKFRERAEKARDALHQQEVRRLWRALALIVKAKLESVNSGVSAFESEFLASIVATKGGDTVGDVIIPKILKGGFLPQLMEKSS
jgi:hypothetical protein